MADRIVLNTISYHGHGAIENIVPELTARGYKKAFVCSDPDLIKFGVTKKVTDLLDAANFAYAVYSEIKPNPTIANVQDGVAAFKAAEADCIVTIGGGSSMDTAKAIGIIINNPEFADVRSLEGVAPTKKHAVFTIAVPTTAGTAAEVTINYVITDVDVYKRQLLPIMDKIAEEYPDLSDADLDLVSYKMQKYVVRRWLLDEGKRVDGRGINEIRPLAAEVGILPRVHGSGMFTRGQTQVLTTCTLGGTKDNQLMDDLTDEQTKRYIHHYNFPPYSVGEARAPRSPGRREIGHGALAERALVPVLPSLEEFPYTCLLYTSRR